jgi:hypothetical protein
MQSVYFDFDPIGVKQLKSKNDKITYIENHYLVLKPLDKTKDFNGFKKTSKILSDNNDLFQKT